jgi:hypothetical protein
MSLFYFILFIFYKHTSLTQISYTIHLIVHQVQDARESGMRARLNTFGLGS